MLAHLKSLHNKVFSSETSRVFGHSQSHLPSVSGDFLLFTFTFSFHLHFHFHSKSNLPSQSGDSYPSTFSFQLTFIFSFSLSLLVFTFTLFVSLRAGLSQQRQKLEGPFASCKIPSKKNLPLYSRDFVVSPVSRHF